MIKLFRPDSWPKIEQQIEDQVAFLVKVSSRGLIGEDMRAFVKRAGYRFADWVRRNWDKNANDHKGEELVHQIAMGSTESIGPNRNGDGFRRARLEIYHPTFRKFARAYRNHANKNPAKSYGIVPYSDYNPDMERVELLVGYNATKEAADRNGGLLADEEMKVLESGKPLAVSMACRVPFDKCSSCGNKARHRGEYCMSIDEGGMCKGGGLKHRMGQYCGEDHSPILHADNPDPTFFDISKVVRPADRTAYTLGVVKAAADVMVKGGAAQAEFWGVTEPAYLHDDERVVELVKLAGRMAMLEEHFDANPLASRHAAFAFDVSDPPNAVKVSTALNDLAAQSVVLTPTPFFQLCGMDRDLAEKTAAGVADYLPSVFRELLQDVECADFVSRLAPDVSAVKSAGRSASWAADAADSLSLRREAVERRMWRSALLGHNSGMRKSASQIDPAYVAVGRSYAVYQLAAASAITAGRKPAEADELLSALAAQNRA